MKRWIIIVPIGVFALAAGLFSIRYYVKATHDWASSITWDDPNLLVVADGIYLGCARFAMPAGTAAANTEVTVRVTVKDHRYAAIEVVGPSPAVKGMNDFAQMIIARQSTKPDAISGATVTKKLILKAVAAAVSES